MTINAWIKGCLPVRKISDLILPISASDTKACLTKNSFCAHHHSFCKVFDLLIYFDAYLMPLKIDQTILLACFWLLLLDIFMSSIEWHLINKIDYKYNLTFYLNFFSVFYLMISIQCYYKISSYLLMFSNCWSFLLFTM